MPATIEALAVVLVAVLPGALYVWAFERLAGRWGLGFSDRLFRFIGISALFHAATAPATYRIWHDYLRDGDDLPLWLWPVALAYVLVPVATGTLLATGFREGWGWAKILTGRNPAPTAWDAIFFDPPPYGYVLAKLHSEEWVGGIWAPGSYAGGYPEPADLFISLEAVVDQEQGDFVRYPSGEVVTHEYGILLRWAEIEYLEVAPTMGVPNGQDVPLNEQLDDA